jgi:nitrogen fixation/metabolism regulation signal transduction histidine kinase
MTETKYKRRKYIINPKFQYFMLGFALFQSLITSAVLFALNYHFFHKFKIMGQQANIPENHIYFQFLNEQQAYFGKAIFVVYGVIGIFLLTTVTVLSHRVAGPLYRLTKHMKDISEGKELNDVHFRTNDFFPELADTFNRMSSKLKEEDRRDSKKNKQEAA